MKYEKKDVEKLGRVITTGGPRDIQRRQKLMQRQAQSSGIDNSVVEDLKNKIEILQLKLEHQSTSGGFTPEQVDEEIGKATIAAVNKTKVEYEEKLKKLEIENIEVKNRANKAEHDLKELRKKLEVDEQKLQEDLDTELEKVEEKYTALVDKYKNKLETAEDKHRAALSAKDDTIEGLKERIEDLKNKPDDNKLTMLLSEATEKIERMAAQMVDGDPISLDPDRPQMEEVFIDPSSDEKLESHINVEDVSSNKKEDMSNKVNKLKGLLGKLPNKKIEEG